MSYKKWHLKMFLNDRHIERLSKKSPVGLLKFTRFFCIIGMIATIADLIYYQILIEFQLYEFLLDIVVMIFISIWYINNEKVIRLKLENYN